MKDEQRPLCSLFILHPSAFILPMKALLALGLFFAVNGCRNCDLVEAELRTRENDVRALKGDLGQAQLHNAALMREICALRQNGPALIPPEQAAQVYTLKEVTLGRQTGGYDDDHLPGDEALQVVLEPRDVDGHVIKAPGALQVQALEISTEGLKIPLSSWDVPPDHLRRTWRSGLWTNGYFVVLPWKNWPSSDRVRVIARFTLPDGRVFEADKDVTVHLTPAVHRRATPPMPPADPPGVPSPVPETPLPVPRKVEPQPVASAHNWCQAPEVGSTVIQTTAMWRPKSTPSLADAVELLRPAPLAYEPGQAPEP
jgi:hypothetical protein